MVERRKFPGFQFATKLAPDAEAVLQATNAGFNAAEFWTDSSWLGRAGEIVDVSCMEPIHFAIHFPNCGIIGGDRLWNAIWIYRELNARVMVIHEPMFEKFASALLQLDSQVVLAVENGRQQGGEFSRWAEGYRWLTFDVEHFWKYTLNDCSWDQLIDEVHQFLGKFGSKVRHIHLPGAKPGQPEHQPAYFNTPLAEAIFENLIEIGYGGFVVSEADQSFQQPQHLVADVEMFQNWVEKHSAYRGVAPASAVLAS